MRRVTTRAIKNPKFVICTKGERSMQWVLKTINFGKSHCIFVLTASPSALVAAFGQNRLRGQQLTCREVTFRFVILIDVAKMLVIGNLLFDSII